MEMATAIEEEFVESAPEHWRENGCDLTQPGVSSVELASADASLGIRVHCNPLLDDLSKSSFVSIKPSVLS